MVKKKKYKKWSKKDISVLKKYFPHMSTQKVAEKLGRKVNVVTSKAGKLGLNKTEKHRIEIYNRWSPKEIEYLRKYYTTTKNKILAKKLGRTIKALISKGKELGLHKKCMWSPEKIKFLKKHYPTMDTQRISKELNRAPQAVRIMASKLGVHKTKKYIREMLKAASLQVRK